MKRTQEIKRTIVGGGRGRRATAKEKIAVGLKESQHHPVLFSPLPLSLQFASSV